MAVLFPHSGVPERSKHDSGRQSICNCSRSAWVVSNPLPHYRPGFRSKHPALWPGVSLNQMHGMRSVSQGNSDSSVPIVDSICVQKTELRALG